MSSTENCFRKSHDLTRFPLVNHFGPLIGLHGTSSQAKGLRKALSSFVDFDGPLGLSFLSVDVPQGLVERVLEGKLESHHISDIHRNDLSETQTRMLCSLNTRVNTKMKVPLRGGNDFQPEFAVP